MPAVGPSELEAALIIRSDTPRRLAEQISELTSIAGHRLHPEPPQPIRDLYFDTPEHALASKHVALRLRTIGDRVLVTLKGPARLSDWGGAERLELEEPWSEKALARMVEGLRRAGAVLRPSQGAKGRPTEDLTALGLTAVQDRETHRQPRGVTRMDDTHGTQLAELAVDAVIYHFGETVIRLFDVEIEAKSAGGPPVVRAITERLVSRYRPALQPWPYGKLVTGEVIERLLRESALDGLLGPDNTLMPAAFDRIESVLTREGP